MTTTNNNREYAIRLYYEIREADNSINCKTAYKVFDNMQDAANYAIDFIANNPDANIRLTNEHFDGSQISVYGDSPTKHYDLTDADINAVRNVEVNEADVEDYAVTEEAQDVATNSEIENAQANDVKVTEQDNSNVAIEAVNPERFRATVYYYRPDENGGEPWHGYKYQQFATAADAANFIIKFAAEHYDYTITTDSNIRDWDNRKQYRLTGDDINAINSDTFVKTTRQAAALKDKIARDAEPSDDDNTFDLLPDVDDLNDIESERDYWAGIEKQIDYEFGNFTARIGNATVTFRDNHIVKICEDNLIYTKVNGRRQFRISGRLVSKKEFAESILQGTDNQPEPPTVNDDEDKIFTFEVGKTYYGEDFDGEWTTDCKVIIHTLTVISRTAKTLTAVDEAGNTVTKKIVLGYSGTRESVNVPGVNDTTVQTVNISANHEYTPAIAAVSTEHYLDWMNAVENIELGLPIPDETPATPTVAELEAEIADNLRSIDEAYTELEAIEAEVGDEDCLTPQEHIDYLNDFIAECRERVNECRNQIDSIKAEGDFAREYAQAAEATDRIRKIDPDAEIIFAVDEEPAERFILTTGDNSCANCATAAEAEDLFYQLQDDKPAAYVKYPTHEKFPNGEILWSPYGTWSHIESEQYGADIYRNGLGGVDFVIRDDAGEKSFVTEDEFFAEMVKRGACSIDTPEPPADDFAAQLERLRNIQDAAKRQRDFAQDAFDKAQSAWQNAQYDVIDFLNDTSQNLRDQLLGEDIFSAYITVTAHDGKLYPNQGLGHIWIGFLFKERKFGITCDWKYFATYDTPEQVTAAIELLRTAIADAATEFTFPTVDELDSVRNVSAAVSKLNAAAPEGWEVVYSFARKNFVVKFKDETVGTLDSLVLAKILPPDKFFAQFNAEHFADDLDREIADLQDMRAELADDPERSKILDELIADGKREKFIAQLTLPTSTPTAAC